MNSERIKPLILIVDDTPKNIQVLGKTLYDIGYNVSIATSGSQALESVRKESPDLILLDIQMPEMDGFEVCKILKKNPDTKEIPIIFLTAVIESEKIVQGFEIGAVDYITKPFHTAELTMRIATHIEIKQSREKIKKSNEQLKELNATKDKFFRIIAHDLRNPFVGIIGLSENMKNSLIQEKKEGLEKFYKYTEIINTSSKSAASLLENLLEWARSQTGEININPKNISINDLFNKNIQIVSAMAIKKNITIEIAEMNNEIAYTDELLVNTILRNLLTNAIKFTYTGGKVVLSTEKKKDFLEISVADTGIGIAPGNIEKVFKIDSKFSNLGTEKEKGTGLGLILSKEFVEKQGGTIWVESELGKGSKFTFSLPLERKETNFEK